MSSSLRGELEKGSAQPQAFPPVYSLPFIGPITPSPSGSGAPFFPTHAPFILHPLLILIYQTLVFDRESSCQAEFLKIDALHSWPPGLLPSLGKSFFSWGYFHLQSSVRRAGHRSKGIEWLTPVYPPAFWLLRVCLELLSAVVLSYSLDNALSDGHSLLMHQEPASLSGLLRRLISGSADG